jgi:DNA-binding CsgD family transcriptional regulator
MQFLRAIELLQMGGPVSVGRIAACTRTSRETVRDWMKMLHAHGRAQELDRAAEPPAARRGAPPEWWQWTAARSGESQPTTAHPSGEHLEMAEALARARARRNPWCLTLREAQVMTAVCTSASHKHAAAELGVSPLTVKSATQRIGKKMGLGGAEKYAAWERWLRGQHARQGATKPVAEIVGGVLRWHIPAPDAAVEMRFRSGHHMLYAMDESGPGAMVESTQ